MEISGTGNGNYEVKTNLKLKSREAHTITASKSPLLLLICVSVCRGALRTNNSKEKGSILFSLLLRSSLKITASIFLMILSEKEGIKRHGHTKFLLEN